MSGERYVNCRSLLLFLATIYVSVLVPPSVGLTIFRTRILGGYRVLELDVVPNTISTIFWVARRREDDVVPAVNFGLGSKILNAKGNFHESCTISYGWIVDVSGAPVKLTGIKEKPMDCSHADYLDYRNGMCTFLPRNARYFIFWTLAV